MKFPRRAAVVAAPLLVLSGLTSVPTAQAHPLGNFSVNHYDGLRLSHDRIEDTAVVDSAEIPTAQDEEATDTDHDGTIAPAEAADRAADRCARLAGRTRVSVDGRRIAWHVNRSTLTYGKGAAGCPCRPAYLHPAGRSRSLPARRRSPSPRGRMRNGPAGRRSPPSRATG